MSIDNPIVVDAQAKGVAVIRGNRPYSHLVAKVEALFIGWTEAIASVLAEHEVLFVEREFTFALVNPETEASSRTFLEAGKIDAGLRSKRTGQIKILEHKTTIDSIESDSTYWGKLAMDSQISKYLLAARHDGFEDINTVLYDVIRKPAQRPRGVPVQDVDGLAIVLDGNGQRVRTKSGTWRQSGNAELSYVMQTREETPEEFRDRILETLRGDRALYFTQREIPRLDTDLLEYMNDAWALSQQILYYRSRKLWPRNPQACTAFGTCEFFTLCMGRDRVDGIKFDKAPKAHAELSLVPGDKEFLTNSRLNALRRCARYHFLKYEEPTEIVGEVNEALAVGDLFHKGAEVFLKQQQREAALTE